MDCVSIKKAVIFLPSELCYGFKCDINASWYQFNKELAVRKFTGFAFGCWSSVLFFWPCLHDVSERKASLAVIHYCCTADSCARTDSFQRPPSDACAGALGPPGRLRRVHAVQPDALTRACRGSLLGLISFSSMNCAACNCQNAVCIDKQSNTASSLCADDTAMWSIDPAVFSVLSIVHATTVCFIHPKYGSSLPLTSYGNTNISGIRYRVIGPNTAVFAETVTFKYSQSPERDSSDRLQIPSGKLLLLTNYCMNFQEDVWGPDAGDDFQMILVLMMD